MAVSQRDFAAAVGTVAGEALNEPFEGQAAVVDVLANRVTYARDGYGVITEPGIAGVARAGRYGPSGRAGMREFDAWSPGTNARAYATATMFEKAILDPAYRETLPETHKAKLEQIERATHGVLVDGSLRGITKGATFYNNPGITSTAMNGKMDALRPTGSFRIGGHVFGGKNYDPSAKFDTKTAKANAHAGWAATGVYGTAGEKARDQRALEGVRADMTRFDAAVTAPYWDGSVSGTTTSPTLSPVGFNRSADPYDLGQFTPANAVQTPMDFGGGLESGNAGYSEPTSLGQSFGGMLADRAAPMDTYSTGGSFGADRMPDNFSGGMEQANAGFGGWTPDGAAVANFAGGLEGANRGYGGGLPESWASGPAAPDNFAGSLEASNAGTGIFDSYSTGGSFGADRMPDNFAGGLEAANAGQIGAFDTAPTRGFSAPDRAIDVGWGVGAREDRSALAPSAPSPMDLGPVDLGANLSSSMPSSRMTERAAPMVDPFASLPQAYPIDDIPAFAETPPVTSIPAPAAASRPSTAISRPSGVSAPNRPSAAPTRAMAPALPAPINVAMPAISPSFGPGLTQGLSQAAETLNTYGAPNDFLGSIVGGGADQRAASVGALNAATGQDWSGTARVAAGDDVFAQPAMLGMGNAYAQATGQQGYKSLFDGLSMPSFGFGGSSPASSGWGTGGLYDPSGAGGLYDTNAASGGLFGGFGFSNPFDGMFSGGGNGGGYGNTPGAGGLY